MAHLDQLVYGQAVKHRLREQIAADGHLQQPQGQLTGKAECLERFRILGAIGGHDGKVKPAGPIGTQTTFDQFGQQAVQRHALRPRRPAKPDAVMLAVLDRYGGQHCCGRLAVFFQYQNIFKPCHILQPACGIGAVGAGRFAAQRHQRGHIFFGCLAQHGPHLFCQFLFLYRGSFISEKCRFCFTGPSSAVQESHH